MEVVRYLPMSINFVDPGINIPQRRFGRLAYSVSPTRRGVIVETIEVQPDKPLWLFETLSSTHRRRRKQQTLCLNRIGRQALPIVRPKPKVYLISKMASRELHHVESINEQMGHTMDSPKSNDSNIPVSECQDESIEPSLKQQSSISTTPTTDFSTLVDSPSMSQFPHLPFHNESLTFAHLEDTTRSPPNEKSTSASILSSPTDTIDPVRHCSVAFFDLDDTLIPTDWVRRAFVTARNVHVRERGSIQTISGLTGFPSNLYCSSGSPSGETVTIYEALTPSIQNRVRHELEKLGGEDFDERAASIVEKACMAFGVVVVVTNARSVAWLRIVSDLFPKLKAQLRRFSVPIIRAAVSTPGTAGLRSDFASVGEYFQYWAELKRFQFNRVASATRGVLMSLQSTCHFSARVERTPHFLSDLLPTWISVGQQQSPSVTTGIHAFRQTEDVQVGTRPGRSMSDGSSSQLSRLAGGELLLSPRSHGKESHELEDILRRHEVFMSAIDDHLLVRIVTHQVRRFLLHHHSHSNPDISEMPYSPRSLLTGEPPTFPETPSHSLYVKGFPGTTLLRPQGQPLHKTPHLPGDLRQQFARRQAAQLSSWAHSRHIRRLPNNGTLLDIICVGDSEFELSAARELAMNHPEFFRGVGLIKCHTGLSPDAFRDQLDEIEAAMACISIEKEDPNTIRSGARHLGPFVVAEFVTRACGFRTELLGLSLAERETLRLRRQIASSQTPNRFV